MRDASGGLQSEHALDIYCTVLFMLLCCVSRHFDKGPRHNNSNAVWLIAAVSLENKPRLAIRQIKEHLSKVAICPREPWASVVG